MLRRFPGWGIGLNIIKKGYALIFEDRLRMKGPLFKNCRDLDAALAAMRSIGKIR